MGLRRLLGLERRDLGADLHELLLDAGGWNTAAGVHVTPLSSLGITAVYASVRLLAESVAGLPVPVYRRDGRSRVRVHDDPRWPLLNRRPNPEMTAFELWSLVVAHANLWGNAFLAIDRGSELEDVALWPLDPRRTRPERDKRTNALSYVTRLPNGEEAVIRPADVIHVKALATAGDVGLSPIATARQSLGLTVAAEEFGARYFANDARPGVVVTWPGRMDNDQEQAFRQKWESRHRGVKRSNLLGILTGNADVKTVGIPAKDAEFIATRKYGVREIARIFRVPPYMLADLEPGSVSYASVEQQAIDFAVHSLRPWLVRIEQALAVKLFTSPADRRAGLYPEFLVDGLLRGDAKTRYEAFAIGVQNGWLSRADVREIENLPERPGLDEYLTPVNMQPAAAGNGNGRGHLVPLPPLGDAS
jgi:HK97 family phage portal protein